MLQSSSIEVRPTHSSPPWAADTFGTLVFVLLPHPHVSEQSLMLQSAHSQWTIWKIASSSTVHNLFDNTSKLIILWDKDQAMRLCRTWTVFGNAVFWSDFLHSPVCINTRHKWIIRIAIGATILGWWTITYPYPCASSFPTRFWTGTPIAPNPPITIN